MRKLVVNFTGVENPPQYASKKAAGADLYANNQRDIFLAPGERAAVPTGLRLAIPDGYEGEIRPRSGLALKYGVTMVNSPGTIDSDYRGEVKVILINLGEEPYAIRGGDRIAQIIFRPAIQAEFSPLEDLGQTKRGARGFGSTGR